MQAYTRTGTGRGCRKAAGLQNSVCFHGMNVLLHMLLPTASHVWDAAWPRSHSKKKRKSQKEKADHSCSSSAGLHTPACSSADRNSILKGRLTVPARHFSEAGSYLFTSCKSNTLKPGIPHSPVACWNPRELNPSSPVRAVPG